MKDGTAKKRKIKAMMGKRIISTGGLRNGDDNDERRRGMEVLDGNGRGVGSCLASVLFNTLFGFWLLWQLCLLVVLEKERVGEGVRRCGQAYDRL